MSKQSFIKGALILTVAGLMVKVIGSVNRILLSRLLGGEGIGLYQMAYPIYLLLLAVSAAGIPVAISIVVAEYEAKGDKENVRRVFKISLRALALVGLVLAVLLYAGAGAMVQLGIISDPRAMYALQALTPAVLFATLLASFRGYFQGQQLMTPPAISQILEQLVRVMTMIILAYVLLPRGLEYAAAGAAFGAVPGSLAGLVVLSYFYRKYSREQVQELVDSSSNVEINSNNEDKGSNATVGINSDAGTNRVSTTVGINSATATAENSTTVGIHSTSANTKTNNTQPVPACALLKRLALLALPVSLANIMVPISSGIDMLLVPKRLLECGYSMQQATTMFGYLAGMAQPLIMMGTIPTLSLAASLVPAISQAHTLGDSKTVQERCAAAMEMCCLFTIPAALGMSVLAEPISLLLYGTREAGVALLHCGPAILFLGLQQVSAGMLQGVGHTRVPMVTMAVGSVVKVVAVWLLTTATWHIAGAAWATNINFALIAALNIFYLKGYSIGFPWYNIGKIGAAGCIMAVAAVKVHGQLLAWGNTVATLGGIAAGVLVYGVLLAAMGLLNKEKLRQLKRK